ncbi:LmbE family N-acetylglucosaminyl deacetylase [Saonia flava]|uniref:LmbE family N-acetylglucosaminyl deacetylase n=1 Tax=Saonia flava TaxID=523696 RepID=A0A846QWX9_9FLAO|nr:PIG-L family deacetylase [Saonia flava]NJB69614.1 LmbE family N-acetylglucosaminyl deacetylase [Saonia flava]
MKNSIQLIVLFSLCAACKNTSKLNQEMSIKTVMAVFAHADDETTISPLLAKYSREGIKVHLIVTTDGRHGVRPHAKIPAGDSLAKLRKAEIQCVADKLGIHSLVLLNFEDGTLANPENLNLLERKVDSLYLLIKPDILFSWGADGGTGHPDHRTVSNITSEVFKKHPFRASQKLLLFGLSKKTINTISKPKSELGKLMQSVWKTVDPYYLNYPLIVEQKDIETGRQALNCHQSQFITDEMDDFYNILHQKSDTIYFQNSHY